MRFIIKKLIFSLNLFKVQLFSEKFTGLYYNLRDDDLSSKQGSLCTFKMMLIKIIKN